MSFVYSAYGLTIESDLEFPELSPSQGVADVRVAVGRAPEHLENPVEVGQWFEAKPGAYLLRIPGVAAFHVTDGRHVLVEPDARAEPVHVRGFLGTVLTGVLHQRGRLVLHAGAILGHAGAVLIGGFSGGGKSTLLAALAARGHQVLADDVAAIEINRDGQPSVFPGVPRVNLWKDALARLGRSHAGLDQIRSGEEKFAVPVAPLPDGFPKAVRALYVLRTWDQCSVAVEELNGASAFRLICAQTRNVHVVRALGMQTVHFHAAAAMASRICVNRVSRPRQANSLPELVALVEGALGRIS